MKHPEDLIGVSVDWYDGPLSGLLSFSGNYYSFVVVWYDFSPPFLRVFGLHAIEAGNFWAVREFAEGFWKSRAPFLAAPDSITKQQELICLEALVDVDTSKLELPDAILVAKQIDEQWTRLTTTESLSNEQKVQLYRMINNYEYSIQDWLDILEHPNVNN